MGAVSIATKGIICCPGTTIIELPGTSDVVRIEEEIERPLVLVKSVEIEEAKKKEKVEEIIVTGVKFDNGESNNNE